MPILGRVAVATVAGGIALGTMLGAAANPVMKQPPAKPFVNAFEDPVEAQPPYLMIEDPPEDLTPYRDSYAPTWAREELTDWEPDYPAWTYSTVDDNFAEPPAADEPRIDEQAVPAAVEVAVAPEAVALPDAPAAAATGPRRVASLDPIY